MFETKEGLEKGMREATKNLEESRGLAKWQHWPGPYQVSWSLALHYITLRQFTLAETAANTATCSSLPWWRARAPSFPWAWFCATFWSFQSENHHAAAYNTSWTLLSSQSRRPSSWSSCPSPGPHWSVVCSLKAHSSKTQGAIKWQDI